MKEGYFKSFEYHVKAHCKVCHKEFSDIVQWDFGEWFPEEGVRAYRESLGLEEQMNARYKCCPEQSTGRRTNLIVFYSKQLTADKKD